MSYGESAEKSFRYVGDYDSNEKDDSIQPVVAERHCDDEKQHSEEDCKERDDVNEVTDFTADWSHFLLES